MCRFFKHTVFLCAIFYGAFAHAWGASGHLIMAQIAYDHLTPQTKAQVDKIIAVTAKQYLTSANFVTASLWADDLKFQGDKRYNALHYVNLYINMKGSRVDRPVVTPNVITAIIDAQKILQDKTQSLKAQSLALRGLIHWVGDIHQPLHCVSRISPATPQGDKGGVLFPLAKRSGYSNLHAYWDNGLGGFPKIKRPKTVAQQKRLQSIARDFENHAVIPESDILILQPEAWAQESLDLAITLVYPRVYPKDVPSLPYQTQGEIIARERVVLAGLRLAALLNGMFPL